MVYLAELYVCIVLELSEFVLLSSSWFWIL